MTPLDPDSVVGRPRRTALRWLLAPMALATAGLWIVSRGKWSDAIIERELDRAFEAINEIRAIGLSKAGILVPP